MMIDDQDLAEKRIALIDEIKRAGKEMEELVIRLDQEMDVDRRWVGIGKTHLQQGCMALIRSITCPNSF